MYTQSTLIVTCGFFYDCPCLQDIYHLNIGVQLRRMTTESPVHTLGNMRATYDLQSKMVGHLYFPTHW